jgi:hypothetical protein
MDVGRNSRNATPTTTVGNINGTLMSEIRARRPKKSKLAVIAAIGRAKRITRIVLMVACQVVNQTTFRVVGAVIIANDLKSSEILKIFNMGATTNISIATTGKTASHLLVD